VAEIYIADGLFNTSISPNTYVTVAGVVRAPNGAGLKRKVYIFQTHNLNTPVAVVESDALGAFSTQVMGHSTTEFTVIADGELGENTAVYGHSRVF
jgi:hypothetical protein